MKMRIAAAIFIIFMTYSLTAQDSVLDIIPTNGIDQNYEEKLSKMMEEVSQTTTISSSVLDAMAVIPRHYFAPEQLFSMAYKDRALPLGGGRFIPSPTDLANVFTQLYINPLNRILIVGNSVGYAAEVVSLIASEVVVIEEDVIERENHINLITEDKRFWGRNNLTIRPDTSLTNLLIEEPFDVIIIHGGISRINDTFYKLLKPSARMAAFFKIESGMSLLAIYRKTSLEESFTTFGEMFVPEIMSW